MKDMNKEVDSAQPTNDQLPLSNENGNVHEAIATPETETNSTENQVPQGRDLDPNMDPKKLKRILASRQYSQKYRLKQLQHIMKLESEVKALHAKIAINSPRIKYCDSQNSLLRVENGSMMQKLSAFTHELMFKEAQYKELKKERDVLKQFYMSYQHPVLVRTKPGENYQFLNMMNLNQPGYSQFMGPAVMPHMVNQNLNQFGPGQNFNMNSHNRFM